MCELFGISASAPFTPADAMRTFRLRGGRSADNPDGWGIAYREGASFRLFKAPEPAAGSALFEELCSTVRSNLILAHVRKANYPPVNTLTNTHPFLSECCGKEWAFAHNGLVPEVVALELAREHPVCRPGGQTDSEYAFCHLLGYIAQRFDGAELPGSAAWLQTFATISELVAAHGKFNFLMSDGEHLIAYGHDGLHYLERHGGDQPKIDWPEDSALVATQPLDDDAGWAAFDRGELRLYRLGILLGRILTAPRSAANRDPAAIQALP
ncbi:MAG TPA: class II glutamine amidotransferase [Rhodocyclaceae bacterium]|nr:class II glutamine amidotransferase [Rhodocyclaceae bacterium]